MSLSSTRRALAAEPGSALLVRARAGDHTAFLALVHPHDSGLRRLAYRLLGDRERMDDALQEAYLRAYRGIGAYRGDAALGTWLYRIVYNVCLEELDRARRQHVLPIEDERGSVDPLWDVEERVTLRAELADALAALPPPDRAAVLLVDAEGFDYRGAGEVLGVSEGTIASRLHRARRALRRALAGRMEGVSE